MSDRVPRSGVRADSLERDHRREPGGAAQRCATSTCRPDMHEGSLHSFNVAFQRELPGRFTLDVAYVGNRGHDVQTRSTRTPRPSSAGRQRRPAAVPAVRQIGGRDDLDRDQDRVQLAAGEAGSPVLRRPAGDDVVHARARQELRQRRLATPTSRRRPTSSGAGRAPIRTACTASSRASSTSCRSGPDRRWLRDGPLSQILGGWQLSGIFSAQSGSPIEITMSRRDAQRAGQHAAAERQRDAERAGRDRPGHALVRHVGVLVAGAEHLRQCAAQRRARRPGLREPRRHDREAVLVRGRVKGEFRVDIFNITNTPHFNNPERDVPRRDVRADHEHDGRQRADDAVRVSG